MECVKLVEVSVLGNLRALCIREGGENEMDGESGAAIDEAERVERQRQCEVDITEISGDAGEHVCSGIL